MGKEGSGSDRLQNLANKALDLAKEDPELAKKTLDLFGQVAGGGGSPGQGSESPQPKKPLKKGISTQTKLMMGIGALMLMLVLGPMLFPAIAGMGAVGSAVMAGAGAGLLAYGINKARNESNSQASTGYSSSNRVAPDSQGLNSEKALEALQKLVTQQSGPGQATSQDSLRSGGQEGGIAKALKEVSGAGVADGIKSEDHLIKEVDAERKKLMDKLALPDILRGVVNKGDVGNDAFDSAFDKHLREVFFANLGEDSEKTRGDNGMGRDFLIKSSIEDTQEKKAFDEFKNNMKELLKKDKDSGQSHDRNVITEEKKALQVANEEIESLAANNKLAKANLDSSHRFYAGADRKEKADKNRLGYLQSANGKIDDAVKKVSSAKQSAPAQAPAQDKAPAQAPGRA